MGREQARSWKRLNLCLAVAACFSVTACALIERLDLKPASKPAIAVEKPARYHLDSAEALLLNEDYEAAIQENDLALAEAGNSPPADEALFNMVVLQSHPGNQSRDLAKSAEYLERLATSFPGSSWTIHGKVWVDVAQEIERRRMMLKGAFQELDEQRKASAEIFREANRLKRVSGEAFQEIDRIKRMLNDVTAENQKLKKIAEQSRNVDIEIDERKRQQAK